jgi:hypothetical protein
MTNWRSLWQQGRNRIAAETMATRCSETKRKKKSHGFGTAQVSAVTDGYKKQIEQTLVVESLAH